MVCSLLLMVMLSLTATAKPLKTHSWPASSAGRDAKTWTRDEHSDWSYNNLVIDAAMKAAQNYGSVNANGEHFYFDLLQSHPQSVSRHVGALPSKRPAQHASFDKRFWFGLGTGISLAIAGIGAVGGLATGAVCKLTGVTESLAGKISCWGLGALFGLASVYGFGSAGVNASGVEVTASLNALLGGVATIFGARDLQAWAVPHVKRGIECAGPPLGAAFVNSSSFLVIAAAAVERLKHCGEHYSSLPQDLPGSPVLAGTNITARYIDLAFGHRRPLAIQYPGLDNYTRVTWHEPHAQGYRRHMVVTKNPHAASLANRDFNKRQLCEPVCLPATGPGQGEPRCRELCGPDTQETNEQIYYGYDFYGSEHDAEEVSYEFEQSFNTLAQQMNDVGTELDNSGQNRACVCFQNNGNWVSTGEINVADEGTGTGDYSECWASDCDGA